MSHVAVDVKVQGSLAAADDAVTISDTFGAPVVSCQISGTFTGLSAAFEGTDGTTWVSLPASPIAGGSLSSTASSANIYLIRCPGICKVRIRCTAISSGSATIEMVGGLDLPGWGIAASGGFPISRFVNSVSVDAQVQAAAYANGDLVGEKLTFSNSVLVSGGSCYLRGAVIRDQAANTAGTNSIYDLVIFNSDPTGTTFTDNSPLDVADADLSKVLTVIRFSGTNGVDYFPFVDNVVNIAATDQMGDLLIASGSRHLYGAIITRGTPTYAAITDVFVTLHLEQN